MGRPFFSVLITTFNRSADVMRCVRSCMQQTFSDLEVVVVDDGSTDSTKTLLQSLGEPRLRVVSHDRNRGISPARATSVDQARGEWFVMLDSDWELVPHSLARLRERIDELPPQVRIIRSRLEWSDGHLEPEIMPPRITGYAERLKWMEALALESAGSDAGHCIHCSVFACTNYFRDRRGAMEPLWELNLARRERSLWVPDVLGRQHADSPHSYSREANLHRRASRLLATASDEVWMAETMLAQHGPALAQYAPSIRRALMEQAVTQAFLAADRHRGIRNARMALRSGAFSRKAQAAVILGLWGPRPLAYAMAARRWGRRLIA